jgi:hypothetical protein
MVTVKDSVAEELGVRWGFSDQQLTKAVSGTAAAAQTLANGNIPTLDSRYNVNLPVNTEGAGKIGFHISKLWGGFINNKPPTQCRRSRSLGIFHTPVPYSAVHWTRPRKKNC